MATFTVGDRFAKSAQGKKKQVIADIHLDISKRVLGDIQSCILFYVIQIAVF